MKIRNLSICDNPDGLLADGQVAAAVGFGGKAVAGGGIAVAAGGLGLAVQGEAVPRDAFGTSQQAQAVAAVEGKFAQIEAVFVVDAV